jgi:hypothetical protein
MDKEKYLQKILQSQTLSPDSEELKALQGHRADVEALIRKHFDKSSPTIRYGGSKAKGTMISEAYDLDIIVYFPNDDSSAGETLEDIYNNVRKALSAKYLVQPKQSALRLQDNNPKNLGVDFHIDVVPGRFTDDSKTDAFLYQASGDKKRLKTNIDVHIKHVKDSGVTDAIRLLKLWRVRNGLSIKHFALELVIIELLRNKKSLSLSQQLDYVWKEFRDNVDDISIEDPANATGNDLSDLLNDAVRSELSSVAETTLNNIDRLGWESVFGPSEDDAEDRIVTLRQAAASVIKPTKPWSADS